MTILDPGHRYRLATLDGEVEVVLTFVKRDTPPEKYPGNTGAYPGTTTQEVLRALIDRTLYVHSQIPFSRNLEVITRLRDCLLLLEERAAEARRQRLNPERIPAAIELVPTCSECGHIQCHEHGMEE